MKKIILIIILLISTTNVFAAVYTQEEKNAILKYIQSQVKSGIIGPELLFYYLDHKDEIDVNTILSKQKKDRILSLQKSIEKSTKEMTTLEGTP